MVNAEPLRLKVAEAIQDDVNKGIVRIDTSYMQRAGVRPGDIVDIQGGKHTVAIADRAYPGDIGLNIIRMDGIIRRNGKASVGELVAVKKAEVKEAKKVVIAPAKRGILVRAAPEIFKQGLLGRAVVKGDIVAIGGTKRRRTSVQDNPFFDDVFNILDESMLGFGFGDLKFLVADTNPKAAVIITDETQVEFNPEAVEVDETEALTEIAYEDIGGLDEEITKVREMVELPLKHPEVFERLGIEPPKGVLLHGPPGTGKTLLAKAVANETNSHFLVINGPEIMCVGEDTPIFTNPRGYKKIKDIFQAAKGKKISEGRIEAIKLDEPVKSFGFHENKLTKVKITHVAKLKAPTYALEFSDGNTLETSHNQPFLVYNNGQLIWKRVEELSEGMFVARVNKLALPEESQKLVLPKGAIKKAGRYCLKSKNISRSAFVALPARTSPELLEFVGLLVAEGNISKEGDAITFCNLDKALRDRYTGLLKGLFRISTAKEYKDGRIVVYSKTLSAFLEQFGLFAGKKRLEIPGYFYTLPPEEIAAFIRGYFDGDGTVALAKMEGYEYPTPKLYSLSREFLQQMQSLLILKLGIATTLARHPTPKGEMQALVVRGSEGRRLFWERVGSAAPEKARRLALIAHAKRKKEFANIPTPKLLLQELCSRVPYEKYRNNDSYVYGHGDFTRHAYQKLYGIVSDAKALTPSLQAEHDTLMRDDLAWEKITSKRFVGEKELYDFTVDKDNFMGGPLLLLHNSKFYGQSLPYEEKILVSEKGLLKRMPIGEVVESGKEGREVVCFDKEGKIVVSKITGLIKHQAASKMLKVTTRSGRQIRVTGDHSLFTLGKQGIESVPTSSLIAGRSFVAVPKKIPFASRPIESIDLLDALKDEDHGLRVRGVQQYIRDAIAALGHDKAAEILRVKPKYLYDMLSKNVGIRVKSFLELMQRAKIPLQKEEISIFTKGKSLPSQLRITEDLCAFFGLWMAEGSYTTKNEVRLSIHQDEEKTIRELCERLFGGVLLYHKPESKGLDIFICSGVLGILMRDVLGFKSGARKKSVPQFAYNLSRENLSAFLRGYFSGDGSVNTVAPAPEVEADTESPALADDLAYLLLCFGIVAKTYLRKDRPQRRICFADYENLDRFREIGFFDAGRNRVIYDYLLNAGVSRRDRIPIVGEIKEIVAAHFREWKDQASIGRNILQRLEHPALQQLLSNDIYWDKVMKIEEDGPCEHVYDISVEPCQNFIAGTGGIFAHNSEENLRKKFEEAEKNAPSIIFIDEIDAIASKREETKGEVERRVVAQLLALMDGLKSRGKVVVIAATNVPNILDPALRRPGRFDREIEIGVPSKEGRLNILKIHTRGMPLYSVSTAIDELKDGSDPYRNALLALADVVNKYMAKKDLEATIQKFLKDHPDKNTLFKDLSSDKLYALVRQVFSNPHIVDLGDIANITHGFVGADLAALAKESAMIVLRRVLPELKLQEEEAIPKELLEQLRLTSQDFRDALKVVRPSALREVLIDIPNIHWIDIGGLEGVKQELQEAVEWPLKMPEAFKRMGIRPPKGVLMYGAPGTGKTLLAKAVATESESNFILVKGPELLSKWVGESEKAVREVFKKARQTSPTIIFFDEVDALAPRRGVGGENHVSERVVNQLLTEIDGLEEMHDVVIIAATNRPDIVDTALLRPGRFDRVIHVPAPDVRSRLEIFKVHTKQMPIKITDEEHETLSKFEPSHKAESPDLTKKMARDEAIPSTIKPARTKTKPAVANGTTERLLRYLASKTEGYAGADIESVCREAAILALREDSSANFLTLKHFEAALEKVAPSVTPDIEKAYSDLQMHFSSARAKQMKEEMPSYMG